jgi:predicted amidohydrolase YtcJ
MPILPPPPPAIQVLLGADLWTDDGHAAPAQPGQALALKGGRILAVGPRDQILKKYPKAARVELAGGTLLPGFIEGHAHVESIGRQTRQADLAGAGSLETGLARVRAWAQAHPAAWLLGRGWDQNLWPSKTFPSAADLDRVTGGTPAALTRVDGHALWANSAALAAAGITRATPDPAGGSILRDAQGEPTGILLDAATELVRQRIPEPTPAERQASLLDGLRELRRLGFTAVADMGVDRPTLAAYRQLAKAGQLPIRVFAYLSHDTALMLQELRHPRPKGTALFQVQGVKFYMDGALGSRGARLLEAYADAPGNGLWVTDPARVATDARATAKAGYQIAIHAIGDAANRKALDLLAKAGSKPALPARIEHAQIVSAADAGRFGREGVVASVQPMHCVDDHAWTPTRLGPARVAEAYPWRAFLDGGAILAFGSDGPIADPNPFSGMAAAETREDAAGDPPGGFGPEQRLNRAETLRAYTAGNARALGRKDLGVLRAGAAADLVWVAAPVRAVDPAALRKLKPARLWVNGTEVQP